MGSFSQTVSRRLRQASRPAAGVGADSPHQQMIALPDGRKFWATRVPRDEWANLKPGHELLLVRACRAHLPYPACIEMATVEDNRPAVEALGLAWGYLAPEEADDRPAAILYYRDLATILRYELRETGCPDVVATILPTPN